MKKRAGVELLGEICVLFTRGGHFGVYQKQLLSQPHIPEPGTWDVIYPTKSANGMRQSSQYLPQ